VATWVGVRQAGEIAVISVVGRLTIADGCTDLREKVRDTAERGLKNLLLNLSEVPYVDSAGVGEVMAAKKVMERRGGRMKLLQPSRAVRDLLHTIRLDRLIDIFDDEAEAMRSFGG
jgi:anti-sigma B factor antagonist